jgi:phenylacetic acid degradation operon negative regulatory protein
MPAKRPAARSLLVTLFGDTVAPHGGRVWLGSLIRLAAPLGISERLVRTSVFRLVKERWLRPEVRGRRSDYLLTEYGERQFAAATRHIYSLERPAWDGAWRVVVAMSGAWQPGEREHLRSALAWQGFGTLAPGVHIHPSADLERALQALELEDYPRLRQKLFWVSGQAPALEPETIVRSAWQLDELARAYRQFVRRYDKARAEQSGEKAFLQRTLLVHEYRRLLLRDPELPDELLPPAWQGLRARAVFARLYRELAAPSEAYLEEHLITAEGAHPRLLPGFSQRLGGLPRRS